MKKCKILDVGGALLDSEQLEIYLQKLAADQILKSKSDKRTYPMRKFSVFFNIFFKRKFKIYIRYI